MPKKKTKYCPVCNSTDISADFSNPGAVRTGLFHNSFKCNNCGYTNNFFPEDEKQKIGQVKPAGKLPKRQMYNTIVRKQKKLWIRVLWIIILIIFILQLIINYYVFFN